LNRIFPDELKLTELKQLVRIGYAVKHFAQICQCLVVADQRQRNESIPLTGMVVFVLQESLDEVWRIRYELLGVLKYRGNCEDSVLANVSMTMFQT